MPAYTDNNKATNDSLRDKDGHPTLKKALDDFKRAYEYKKSFLDEADSDSRFALGAQWDPGDEAKLNERGVKPLTINKIRPNINLLKGIESQNRSDFKAYPEGMEDSVEAEIATSLLKNVMKNSEGDYKVSETFQDGNIVGESYLEPWLDYSDNILFGKMRFKKCDYYYAFPDPDAKEYDLSDGKFFCKLTFDITKDELLSLFPGKRVEKLLENTSGGKINLDNVTASQAVSGTTLQTRGYNRGTGGATGDWIQTEPVYDLLEYYYKRYVTKYYVADLKMGGIKEAASEEEALAYVKAANEAAPESAKIVPRRVPEIWLMSIIGGIDEALDDAVAPSFPRWKSWPFVPYYAYRYTFRIDSSFRHYLIQGITRGMKDLNIEFNKRRTQELRHLNQSANSGWLTPENAWVDRKKVEEFGSTPGINLEYKVLEGGGKPERIFPMPLSAGHAQLAAENSQDLKDASGINADLLAMEEGGQSSGRAIALRQKQGLVMVQGLFDNLSRSKRILGKYILSQLSEIYTVETAIRVLGEAFVQKNFSVPVTQPVVDPKTGQPLVGPDGQPVQGPVIDPATGQPVTKIDQKAVMDKFNKVLSDTELGNYDVAIGENVAAETIQYGNFVALTELVEKGIPIPPDVLIDESPINSAAKEKVKAAIERAQAAAQTPSK